MMRQEKITKAQRLIELTTRKTICALLCSGTSNEELLAAMPNPAESARWINDEVAILVQGGVQVVED